MKHWFSLHIIDWYIIRKFLGTFFFTIALIILIAVVFDVSEKLDDFIEGKAPLRCVNYRLLPEFMPTLPFFSALFLHSYP
jgi:lipopolysaccharide export system permease protein